ncbi:MAG: SEC-C domain-containing protein [Spirochaetes bacterium]|nr:SEC-C domain-containing protein [Spirochaetota bacterium]
MKNNLDTVIVKSTGCKTGRNDPCPCGLVKKYPKCCRT